MKASFIDRLISASMGESTPLIKYIGPDILSENLHLPDTFIASNKQSPKKRSGFAAYYNTLDDGNYTEIDTSPEDSISPEYNEGIEQGLDPDPDHEELPSTTDALEEEPQLLARISTGEYYRPITSKTVGSVPVPVPVPVPDHEELSSTTDALEEEPQSLARISTGESYRPITSKTVGSVPVPVPDHEELSSTTDALEEEPQSLARISTGESYRPITSKTVGSVPVPVPDHEELPSTTDVLKQTPNVSINSMTFPEFNNHSNFNNQKSQKFRSNRFDTAKEEKGYKEEDIKKVLTESQDTTTHGKIKELQTHSYRNSTIFGMQKKDRPNSISRRENSSRSISNDRPYQSETSEPTITINIGRVEVRSIASSSSESVHKKPSLSLSDYLKGRYPAKL